jgi:V/A-type H+-transporting ATPase subunit F
MRIVVIGSKDECLGFKLAGCETVNVINESDVIKSIDRLLSESDVAVIGIVDRFYNLVVEKFRDRLKKRVIPSIVFIPSFDGVKLKRSLKGYVGDVLGIRL